MSTAAAILRPERITGGRVVLGCLSDYPLVSILISSYNYARFLSEAVLSIVNQTYHNVEVIICDDGSTDDSPAVAERLKKIDDRIHLLCKTNGGQASAWNAAYRACRGNIICMLDADDVFSPGKVEAVVHHFRLDPALGSVVHPLMMVDTNGRAIQRVPLWIDFEEGDLVSKILFRGGRWRHAPSSGLCLRREVAECIFPIPEEEFRADADCFVYTLVPLLARVGAIRDVLAEYRLHGSNLNASWRLTSRKMTNAMRTSERSIEAVNARLSKLGIPHRLELDRNLTYAEQELVLCLLEGGCRLSILRAYLRWYSLLVRDDLYATVGKILSAVMYAIAAVLPPRFRRALLDWGIGPSRFKQRTWKILRRLGFLGSALETH